MEQIKGSEYLEYCDYCHYEYDLLQIRLIGKEWVCDKCIKIYKLKENYD